jgi:Ca-activated chloride channel family protein
MRKLAAALLTVCFVLCAAAGARASDLVLVFDASGSMWGQIQGENKIVAARRVFGKLVDGLPEGSRVALIAYGHRQKADCDDIETVVALGSLDRRGMKKAVDGLDPKGKTPITKSLQQALELVKRSASEDGATVILVSDGLETCDGDPCKAVRDAKAAGVEFVLHIIGFDVAKEDVSSLECAAQAGGGLFLSAENADELSAALESAVALPAEVPASRLSVKAVANGKLHDVSVLVKDAQTGAPMGGGRTYADPSTNPRIVPLPAGIYDISVKAVGLDGDIDRVFRGVEIGEGDIIEKEVDFSSGELAVQVTRNGALSDATVNVLIAGTRTEVAAGRTYRSADTNPRVLHLTAGTYDVVIGSVEIAGNLKQTISAVEVKPSDRVELLHELESGDLTIGVRRGDKLVDAVIAVRHPTTNQQVAGARTYKDAKTNPRTFVLEAREYKVEIAEIRGDKRAVTVVVDAGKTVEKIVDLESPPAN